MFILGPPWNPTYITVVYRIEGLKGSLKSLLVPSYAEGHESLEHEIWIFSRPYRNEWQHFVFRFLCVVSLFVEDNSEAPVMYSFLHFYFSCFYLFFQFSLLDKQQHIILQYLVTISFNSNSEAPVIYSFLYLYFSYFLYFFFNFYYWTTTI